jgi:hypothetical protein
MKSNYLFRLAKIICLLNICSSNVSAIEIIDTLGVDILKSNFALKDQYGSKVFGKNLGGVNIFGQRELSDYLFLEYGYEYMSSKDKNTINRGDYYPGDPNPVNRSFVKFNSKIKQQFPYLGVGVKYAFPSMPNTYVSALGGLAIVKINGSMEITETSTYGPYTPAMTYDSRRSFSKTKPSFLLKVALNHEFQNSWGVRLTGEFRKLSQFKLKSKTDGSLAEIRFYNL